MRLIRITADELARSGYQRMSLRGVASRAGISPATVFHHFPDGKLGLYQATLQHVIDEVRALALDNYGEEGGLSTEEVIVRRAESFWDFLAGKPEFAAMLLRESFDDEPREGDLLEEHSGTVIEYASAFIENAQESGELGSFDARRFLLWSAFQIIGFHGAPRIHRVMLGDDDTEQRTLVMAMMRAYLQGHMPGTN